MNFKTGDWVMHCTHGLGQVVALEERANNGKTAMYYMVQLTDLTIWVPSDENLNTRLRPPSSKNEFQKILNTLSARAEPLPTDRRQRTLQLLEMIKDGRAESLCRVIRDLQVYRRTKTWSEYDSAMLKRAQKTLISEWSFVRSITSYEAEAELNQSLSPK